MKKKYYNKLIRDRITQQIRGRGAGFKARKLKDKEFEQELLKKVGEEASGLLAARNRKEIIEELADIFDVMAEIKKFKKISNPAIAQARQKAQKNKGGFKKRLFLIWSSDDGYKTNEKRYKR